MIAFRPFDIDADLTGLQAFSRRWFGEHAYQASGNYLRWLYEDNPASRGSRDCFVATDGDGQIVGCIHKMPLPSRLASGPVVLASLQNLMIDEAYRKGPGILLLRQSMKNEAVVFMPGVANALAEVYRRMRYQEIPSYWLKRTLNPLRAAAELAFARLGRETAYTFPREYDQRHGDLIATAQPDDFVLADIAGLLRQSAERDGPAVEWTLDLVRWRFFSARGPRHVLIQRRGTDAFAVISAGRRHGVTVARLVEYDNGGVANFMPDVLRQARGLKASLFLGFSTRERYRDALLSDGWTLRPDSPSSFVVGKSPAETLRPSAGASDYGFEAIIA